MMEPNTFEERSEIQDFFEGRTVLITGAGGFLGGVLLDQLLRLCPGIDTIFVLLRKKKELAADIRKDEMLEKPIYAKVKKENPDAIKKVCVISGDIVDDGVGLSSEDFEKIKNVSVVFHCAASISFGKTFKFMVMNNVVGTENVLHLCRKLPKIVAFVHASTAFSTTTTNGVKEELTELPFSVKKLVEEARAGNTGYLDDVEKKYSRKWAVIYQFSKCIAEHVVHDVKEELPVIIVRPSIISNVWENGSLPGYQEAGSGIADATTANILGITKVHLYVENVDASIVPVDIVANTLIIASWALGTQKFQRSSIINCVMCKDVHVTWKDYESATERVYFSCICPYTFGTVTNFVVRSIFMYRLFSFLLHRLPSYFIDFFMLLKGEKPRFVKIYKLLDKYYAHMRHFATTQYTFHVHNFEILKSLCNQTDSKIFSIELSSFNIYDCMRNIKVNKIFQFENDDIDMKMKKVIFAERVLFVTWIYKIFLILLFALFSWSLLKLLFNSLI